MIRICFLVLGLVFHPSFAASGGLNIAAASDLKFALDDVIQAFDQLHLESKAQATYGSSGSWTAQLSQNAPFDLFLAADLTYPKKLVENGLAHGDKYFSYGMGRLVLWVPHRSKLDLEQLGLKAILEPSVRKVAIANPQHAPYGRAAIAALKSAFMYEAAQKKLVLGENVAQAAQFVQIQAADLAIIPISFAEGDAMKKSGRYWILPANSYPKIKQAGLVMKNSKNIRGAMEFRDFILSKVGQSILWKYGYLPMEY